MLYTFLLHALLSQGCVWLDGAGLTLDSIQPAMHIAPSAGIINCAVS